MEGALPSRRLAAFHEFALDWLPPRPARVLEVGCGSGELTLALDADGYSVLGIDPRAPEGAIFRQIQLEELEDEAFDAVVASLSLHHVDSLGAAAAKLRRLLRAGGVLVLEEFARERFTGPAAAWYFHQRHALAAVGAGEAPDGQFEAWLRTWHEEHSDVHPLGDLRSELEPGFDERYSAWGPYLFDYRLADSLEPVERELIDAGAIEPLGFRYVGERR
jgi:SAM-dependent methyltransferase